MSIDLLMGRTLAREGMHRGPGKVLDTRTARNRFAVLGPVLRGPK